jgi:type IV secretory pathway VirB6-like protein
VSAKITGADVTDFAKGIGKIGSGIKKKVNFNNLKKLGKNILIKLLIVLVVWLILVVVIITITAVACRDLKGTCIEADEFGQRGNLIKAKNDSSDGYLLDSSYKHEKFSQKINPTDLSLKLTGEPLLINITGQWLPWFGDLDEAQRKKVNPPENFFCALEKYEILVQSHKFSDKLDENEFYYIKNYYSAIAEKKEDNKTIIEGIEEVPERQKECWLNRGAGLYLGSFGLNGKTEPGAYHHILATKAMCTKANWFGGKAKNNQYVILEHGEKKEAYSLGDFIKNYFSVSYYQNMKNVSDGLDGTDRSIFVDNGSQIIYNIGEHEKALRESGVKNYGLIIAHSMSKFEQACYESSRDSDGEETRNYKAYYQFGPKTLYRNISTVQNIKYSYGEQVKMLIGDKYYNDNQGYYSIEIISGIEFDDADNIEKKIREVEFYLLGTPRPGEKDDRADGVIYKIFHNVLSNKFILFVRAALALSVVIYGFMVLFGFKINKNDKSVINKKDLMMRLFKLTVVVAITSENAFLFFSSTILNFVINGTIGVIDIIAGIFSNSFLKNNIISLSGGLQYANKVISLSRNFAIVDEIIAFFTDIKILSKIISFSYMFPKGGGGILGAVLLFGMLVSIALLLVLVFYLVKLTQSIIPFIFVLVQFTLVLPLAPLFILFGLFEQTKSFLQNWIKFIFSKCLELVAFFTTFYFYTSIIDNFIKKLLSFRVCFLGFGDKLFGVGDDPNPFVGFIRKILNIFVSIEASGLPEGQYGYFIFYVVNIMVVFILVFMFDFMTKEIMNIINNILAIDGATATSGGGGNIMGDSSKFGIGNQLLKFTDTMGLNTLQKKADALSWTKDFYDLEKGVGTNVLRDLGKIGKLTKNFISNPKKAIKKAASGFLKTVDSALNRNPFSSGDGVSILKMAEDLMREKEAYSGEFKEEEKKVEASAEGGDGKEPIVPHGASLPSLQNKNAEDEEKKKKEEEQKSKEEEEKKRIVDETKEKEEERKKKEEEEKKRIGDETKKKEDEEREKAEKERKVEEEKEKERQRKAGEEKRIKEEEQKKKEKERKRKEEEEKKRIKDETKKKFSEDIRESAEKRQKRKEEEERKKKEEDEKKRKEEEEKKRIEEETKKKEEERLEKERLEKERLEKERLEKKRKEEEERKKKEEEEQKKKEEERKRKEEEERKKKEEEERKKKEEEEKKKKEEEERKRKEEEETKKKEEERLEKERLEKERVEKERLEKERLERKRKEEEEKKKKEEDEERERVEKERKRKEEEKKKRAAADLKKHVLFQAFIAETISDIENVEAKLKSGKINPEIGKTEIEQLEKRTKRFLEEQIMRDKMNGGEGSGIYFLKYFGTSEDTIDEFKLIYSSEKQCFVVNNIAIVNELYNWRAERVKKSSEKFLSEEDRKGENPDELYSKKMGDEQCKAYIDKWESKLREKHYGDNEKEKLAQEKLEEEEKIRKEKERLEKEKLEKEKVEKEKERKRIEEEEKMRREEEKRRAKEKERKRREEEEKKRAAADLKKHVLFQASMAKTISDIENVEAKLKSGEIKPEIAKTEIEQLEKRTKCSLEKRITWVEINGGDGSEIHFLKYFGTSKDTIDEFKLIYSSEKQCFVSNNIAIVNELYNWRAERVKKSSEKFLSEEDRKEENPDELYSKKMEDEQCKAYIDKWESKLREKHYGDNIEEKLAQEKSEEEEKTKKREIYEQQKAEKERIRREEEEERMREEEEKIKIREEKERIRREEEDKEKEKKRIEDEIKKKEEDKKKEEEKLEKEKVEKEKRDELKRLRDIWAERGGKTRRTAKGLLENLAKSAQDEQDLRKKLGGGKIGEKLLDYFYEKKEEGRGYKLNMAVFSDDDDSYGKKLEFRNEVKILSEQLGDAELRKYVEETAAAGKVYKNYVQDLCGEEVKIENHDITMLDPKNFRSKYDIVDKGYEEVDKGMKDDNKQPTDSNVGMEVNNKTDGDADNSVSSGDARGGSKEGENTVAPDKSSFAGDAAAPDNKSSFDIIDSGESTSIITVGDPENILKVDSQTIISAGAVGDVIDSSKTNNSATEAKTDKEAEFKRQKKEEEKQKKKAKKMEELENAIKSGDEGKK